MKWSDGKHRIVISSSINALTVIIVFCLLCSIAPVTAGQTEIDEEDYSSAAFWRVNIDTTGNTSTRLTLMAKKDSPVIENAQQELTADLQEALQCTLVNIHSSREDGFSIDADCRIPTGTQDLISQVLLKPSALRSRLEKLGFHDISLSITVPKLGRSSAPRELKEWSYGEIKTYSLMIGPDEKTARDIVLTFGYSESYVLALIAATLMVLIVPIAFILVVRRRSLRLAGKDATAAWFGYWRVHRWIAEGIWLVWLILYWTFHIETFVTYLLQSHQTILNALILILPPGIVSLTCQYLARPLWWQVRGIAWNRSEMLLRGFWEHAASILPVFFIIIGIGSVFQNTGQAMLWFAAAFISWLFGAWMHRKTSKTMPCALHGGELHDNILKMAERAGVKIQQVFVMPSQHLQMGNAFAMQGGRVMITDYLLERLTKKETDCVMAHEIGHVKKHHTLLLSWPGFLVIFLMINVALLIIFPLLPSLILTDPARIFEIQDWLSQYLSYPIALLLTVLIRYFLSRRYERSADEFAALLTSDPESMITSLVKLSRMNLMPISWGRWDEGLSTHPATLRRVERISKKHGIPADRLKMLLDTEPCRQERQGYTVPEDLMKTDLIFSAERKTGMALVNAVFLIFALALIPLGLGSLIGQAGFPPWAYATGIVIVPLAYLVMTSFISVRGYGMMKQELAEKLKRNGSEEDLPGSHFVGIVPEEHPRHYDGHSLWDICFLRGNEDALIFSGDKSRFRIPRDQILSIAQGPSYPGWITIPEIYIRWTDGEKEGVLHLHSLEANSIFGAVRQSKILLSRLLDWKQGRGAGHRMVTTETSLSLPNFSGIKGLHPKTSATIKNLMMALMLIAFLVFGLSFLSGLSKTISWYGFGMAAWGLFLSSLPAWRYADGKKEIRPENR